MKTADVPRHCPVFPGAQNLNLRQLPGPTSIHVAGLTLGPRDASVVGWQCGYHGGLPKPHPHPSHHVGPAVELWSRARPTPAHLAASAVQGGWVPTAAGREGAAARWEVADEMGCEVTCTHLREAAAVPCQCIHQGLTAPPEHPACSVQLLPAFKGETQRSFWAPARPDTAARQF